jgi:hypothetical protein
VRSQCEGAATAAVWPPYADVGDQCDLWRGRDYVNEEGRVQGIACVGPYGVRAALAVIFWLRAGDVETVLAEWDSDNPEVTRLISLNLRDFASALPLLQVSRRMLRTRGIFDLTLLEKRGIIAKLLVVVGALYVFFRYVGNFSSQQSATLAFA